MHKKYIILIAVLGLLAYGNTLFNSFVGDDEFVIKNNLFIRDFKNLPRLFNKTYLTKANDVFLKRHRLQDIGAGELSYRPVSTLTHFFEYAAWKLNPVGYRISDLILHILNAILLYLFVFLIVNDPRIALWSGIIFVVHPISAEAINIISYREDLLIVLFILLSFISFIFYDRNNSRKRFIFYFLSLLSFALAIFAKEMAITFPALLVLFDLYFVYKGNLKKTLVNSYRYLGFIIIALVFLYLNFVYFANPEGGALKTYHGGSLYATILMAITIFSEYMTSFWFPLNIKMLPNYHSMIMTTFFNLRLIFGFGLILMLISLGILNYKRSKLISFFIFWFFITLLPVSNIIPLVNPMAYRYIYLPMVGFCVVAGCLCNNIRNSKLLSRVSPNFYKIIQVSIVGLLIIICIPQNMFFKNRFTMDKEILRNFPDNGFVQSDLAQKYAEQGNHFTAISYYRSAIKKQARNPMMHNGLAVSLDAIGKRKEAIEEFKQTIKLNPFFITAYYNLGIVYAKGKDFKNAVFYLENTIKLDPAFIAPYKLLAQLYLDRRKYKKAAQTIKKALEIQPEEEELKDLLLKAERKKPRK